jgi:glutamate/tyrosine decarboxylase-like PLP-dependent enzyme
MIPVDWKKALEVAAGAAIEFLEGIDDRPVRPERTPVEMMQALATPVPEDGMAPEAVVEALVRDLDPGIMAMPSGRFFGWVIGGGVPAAIAADWLVAAWDQNTASAEATPAVAAAEEVALRWIVELLGLPTDCSGAFVTGAQTANTVGLAAARGEVLRAYGWDVDADGLQGAPRINVVVGAGRHDTIDNALRYVGLGVRSARVVEADDQGCMRAEALAPILASLDGPVIVCAQAGNVNTGGVDPLAAIADLVDQARAPRPAGAVWLHVDGAFGLWARTSPARRHLVAGVERADSWATDAHKWLNTPYDCGVALTAHPAAHLRAMAIQGAYLPDPDAHPVRSPAQYAPELSRRARGVAVYAALRQLGRRGVTELVDRCCAMALRFRDRLGAADGVEILNQVVLNQVLVRFLPPAGDADAHTRAVLAAVQREGTCYPSPTTWDGRAAMRISVSNWRTDEADVDRSVAAILAAHRGG